MIENIRSFLAVIEEGSLNRAALRLRISQPSLSRRMQALEDEVGGRLLERTASGVSPTDAGHAFADRMRKVLAGYDQAMAEARCLSRGQRAQLRVGYLVSAQALLSPALAALRASHPEVRVSLIDQSPGEQIAALRLGELDLAIIGQEGLVLSREFHTLTLATLPVVAMLPDGHPLGGGEQVEIADLRSEEFIQFPESDMPGRNRWIAQLCRRAGFRPKLGREADSVTHLMSLIISEGAVSLAPDYLQSFPHAGVTMIPVSDPHATWDFLVVWQRGQMAKALRVMVDALKSSVGARRVPPNETL